MSFHNFSPLTICRSKTALTKKLQNWGQMLAYIAANGIEVKILLNDFDAVGAPDQHEKIWLRVEDMCRIFENLPETHRSHIEIQVAHPGGGTSWAIATALWPLVRSRAKRLLDSANKMGNIHHRPGLMALTNKSKDLRVWPPKVPLTQTFHQKFLVVDGDKSVIGGLDIDERRFDDPTHDRPAHQTWHDVSVSVEGPIASDIRAYFHKCWNTSFKSGESNAKTFLNHQKHSKWGQFFNIKIIDDIDRATVKTQNKSKLRLVTTTATHTKNVFKLGPDTTSSDIESAHLDLISSARHTIYIETQFLRSSKISKALVQAGKNYPNLELIILLPGAPEEVAYDRSTSSVHRFGEWLQSEALEKISFVYGNRFGAFSLTNALNRSEQNERDALYGKGMVYIHSKVMLIDSARGLISSANLNGRSMRWDYEAGVFFDWPEKVAAFKQTLWCSHLQLDDRELNNLLTESSPLQIWRDRAADRAHQSQSADGHGIVPFPLKRTRSFARFLPMMPENMV